VKFEQLKKESEKERLNKKTAQEMVNLSLNKNENILYFINYSMRFFAQKFFMKYCLRIIHGRYLRNGLRLAW